MHAALVAIVDEQFGEKSCAFIVSRNPGLKAVVLRRHLMELVLHNTNFQIRSN